VIAAVGTTILVLVSIAGDIDFTADDWLNPVGPSRIVELDGTEQVAMVGECQCRHSTFRCTSDNCVNPVGSIQETVMAVEVKMDELG
jgi:hypothetical protein